MEVARTAASRCPRPSGEEEDDRGVAVAGWAGQGGGELGRLVGCTGEARYVLLPLIFVLFYFFFYFYNLFLICFKYQIIL